MVIDDYHERIQRCTIRFMLSTPTTTIKEKLRSKDDTNHNRMRLGRVNNGSVPIVPLIESNAIKNNADAISFSCTMHCDMV